MRTFICLLGVLFFSVPVHLSAQNVTPLSIQENFMASQIIEFQLPNKLRVILSPTKANEIVALSCLIEPGAMFDDEEKTGLSYLMMRVLTKGTENRSSMEISDDLQEIGGRLGARGGYDFLNISAQSVQHEFESCLDILEDIVNNPTFPLNEIETEKKRILAEIQMREDRPPSLAMRKLREKLFAPSRYSLPIEGSPETLLSITQTDLVTTWRERLRPENITISVVGDIDRNELEEMLMKRFGDLEFQSNAHPSIDQIHSPKGGLVRVERDVEQSFIAIGVSTCDALDDDIPALEVATTLLGGGMSSRLFVELRDKKGLAYNVGATGANYRSEGYMVVYIGTSPDKTCESVEGLWQETTRLQVEPLDLDELQRAKNYLLGGTLRGLETNFSQASSKARSSALGLGADYDDIFREKISTVTTKDVMRVANKYFVDPATVIVHPNFTELDCLEKSFKAYQQGTETP